MSCTAGSSSITVTWDAVAGAASYEVWVFGDLEERRLTTGTSITFSDLEPGLYVFGVDAVGRDSAEPGGEVGCLIQAADPPPQGPEPLPEGQAVSFDDVAETHSLGPEVLTAARRGIVTATPSGNYEPDRPATRAEVAAPLVRLWQVLGGDCPDGGTRFRDVAPGQLRSNTACLQAVGITSGTTPSTYSPERPVTRAQAASFLVRMWRGSGRDCPDGAELAFEDVDPAGVHADNIACLHALGLTTGKSPTTYDPGGSVTRAQVAAFGVRLDDLVKETGGAAGS